MKHNDFILNGREVRLHGRDGIVTAYVDGSYVRGTLVSDQETAKSVACALVRACDAIELGYIDLVAGRVAATAGLENRS